MKVQTNYCNNNLLILGVKQLNKIMQLYYFYPLKALWDGQGKIKMYYGMARVKLRCIMGCPELKSSYREKGLFDCHLLVEIYFMNGRMLHSFTIYTFYRKYKYMKST